MVPGAGQGLLSQPEGGGVGPDHLPCRLIPAAISGSSVPWLLNGWGTVGALMDNYLGRPCKAWVVLRSQQPLRGAATQVPPWILFLSDMLRDPFSSSDPRVLVLKFKALLPQLPNLCAARPNICLTRGTSWCPSCCELGSTDPLSPPDPHPSLSPTILTPHPVPLLPYYP